MTFLNSISSRCRSFFSFFAKLSIIVLVCLFFAFAIVWPLWKFATTYSTAFTIVILAIVVASVVFFIVKRISNYIKNIAENSPNEKNKEIKKLFFKILNILIIIATIVSCFVLVIFGKQLLSGLILILGVALYGLFSFVSKKI